VNAQNEIMVGVADSVSLFALRISGTRIVVRDQSGEVAFGDIDHQLPDAFVIEKR